jgi:hypothetical protein
MSDDDDPLKPEITPHPQDLQLHSSLSLILPPTPYLG